MAITIVDPNPHKSVVKEVICRNCGVTLSYVPADVLHETHNDYRGGSDLIHYIGCLKCSKQVTVKGY